MEARLNKNSIPYHKKVYETSVSREETAETVVPDTLPDIAEIINTDGLVLLKSKEVENGRANMAGNINAVVLYIPEDDGGIQKLNITIPFNVFYESQAVSEDSSPVVSAKLSGIDARVLNPRKVLVRAEIIADISCYQEGELDVYDTLGTDADCDVQVLSSNCKISPVTGVREKTFVLNDEYQIPASKPELGEILQQRVDLTVDDIKTVGNKLVFKGAAYVNLMYAGSNNQPAAASFTTSFSQILEMDNIGENPDAQVRLMLTSAYIEPLGVSQDDRAISAELHIVAQAVCNDNIELEYIADAYSNAYELELESSDLEIMSIDRRTVVRENVSCVVETLSAVKEVVNTCACLGKPEVSGGRVHCTVTLKAVYLDENNRLCCADKVITVESKLETDGKTDAAPSDVRCSEIIALTVSGGLEVRMAVDFELVFTEEYKVSPVVSIEIDEENPISLTRLPSVTIVSGDMGADIWRLAKKYYSTPELIISTNKLEEGDRPELLLIPKSR